MYRKEKTGVSQGPRQFTMWPQKLLPTALLTRGTNTHMFAVLLKVL